MSRHRLRQQLWLSEHVNVGSEENEKERKALEQPFITKSPLDFPNKGLEGEDDTQSAQRHSTLWQDCESGRTWP